MSPTPPDSTRSWTARPQNLVRLICCSSLWGTSAHQSWILSAQERSAGQPRRTLSGPPLLLPPSWVGCAREGQDALSSFSRRCSRPKGQPRPRRRQGRDRRLRSRPGRRARGQRCGGNRRQTAPGFVRTKMTAGMKAAPFAVESSSVAEAIVKGLETGALTVWVPPVLRALFALMRVLPHGFGDESQAERPAIAASTRPHRCDSGGGSDPLE